MRNFHVNPRFHPTNVGWNLGLTQKIPTPNFTSQHLTDSSIPTNPYTQEMMGMLSVSKTWPIFWTLPPSHCFLSTSQFFIQFSKYWHKIKVIELGKLRFSLTRKGCFHPDLRRLSHHNTFECFSRRTEQHRTMKSKWQSQSNINNLNQKNLDFHQNFFFFF